MRHKSKSYKLIALTLLLVCALPLNALGYSETRAKDGSKAVNVESGATRTDEFISINRSLSGVAQGLSLIMCGLSKDNCDSMVSAVSQSYNPNETVAIKYIDSSLVDAEKYDISPDPWSDPPYDSNLCWAGSISNMMWMSGWARGIVNPYTGKTFLSEDDVFSFMNSRFVDGGSDTSNGIEFFYSGMYYVAFPGFGHAGLCVVGDRSQYGSQDPRDGLYKSIVASKLVDGVQLVGTTERIKEMENMCTGTGNDSVFQVSIGSLESSSSEHSVTGVGLVIDPSATDYADRYKAILLANSDNDGEPTEEERAIITTDDQREASKAARPNSYTLYPLQLVNNDEGRECWEIVGYSEDERTIIFNMTELKCKTAGVVEAATEQDGTKDSINNVDLQLNYVSLTTEPEEISREYVVDRSISAKTIDTSEPQYLNFYAQNHSEKNLDASYTSEETFAVTYEVIRDKDSKVVLHGTYDVEAYNDETPVFNQTYCNLNLNEEGALKALESGEYTIRLEINPDRTIKEAYYDNNVVDYCKFRIESQGSDPGKETPAKASANTSTDTGDNNQIVVYIALAVAAMLLALVILLLRQFPHCDSGGDSNVK